MRTQQLWMRTAPSLLAWALVFAGAAAPAMEGGRPALGATFETGSEWNDGTNEEVDRPAWRVPDPVPAAADVGRPIAASDAELAIEAVSHGVADVEALLVSPRLNACLERGSVSLCSAVANELSAARTKLEYQRGLLDERVEDPGVRQALDATLDDLSGGVEALIRQLRAHLAAPPSAPAESAPQSREDPADVEILVLQGAEVSSRRSIFVDE